MEKQADLSPQPWNSRPGYMVGSVAIVDDDPQILFALGAWLGLHGLQAVHHTCSETLLKSSLSGADLHNPGFFPLVGAVIDLNLPRIHGIELARRLRRWNPHLSIVIVTAVRNDELARFGPLPQGVRCLQKPFDLDELEDALFPLTK